MSYRKTSTTAFVIADSLAKLSKEPRWKEYFSGEMALLNMEFTRHARDTPVKQLIGNLPLSLSIGMMDMLYIPGMTYHYLFRKLLIESQLNSALSDGVRQVIVLGAGLDTLAIRMARKHAAVQFFEIDLPYTQHTKIQILENIGYDVPHNCFFMAADLAQEKLETVLRSEKSFTPDAPTLVILEGVLMYLSESEVKALFAGLRGLINAPLTIMFGAMADSDQAGNWRLRMTNALLHRGQETTKWHCKSRDMPKFMASLGYKLKEWKSYKELQRQYRSEAEIKTVPEEDENYYIVAKTG